MLLLLLLLMLVLVLEVMRSLVTPTLLHAQGGRRTLQCQAGFLSHCVFGPHTSTGCKKC